MSWYIDAGPESDVIVSSRARLARNLRDYPFPNRLDSRQAQEVARRVTDTFFNDEGDARQDYLLVDLDAMTVEDRQALAEKRLISDDLAREGTNRRLIIRRDEAVSVMIGEEDHLRIQSMTAGFALDDAFRAATDMDRRLQGILPIACDERFGFLTACPTNTGTGLRASVMAHLPGLADGNRIRETVSGMGKMGFAVRGLYGEHSKSKGNLFQISNQLTLGISEDDLIADLQGMLRQLMEQEREARQGTFRRDPARVRDKVARALGAMRYAYLLPAEEALAHLSDLRLGLSLGLLPGYRLETLNRIMAAIGPASVQKAAGHVMNADERDQARAEMVRRLLRMPPDQVPRSADAGADQPDGARTGDKPEDTPLKDQESDTPDVDGRQIDT